MLDDMAHPRTFSQPCNEAAWYTFGTAVLVERRDHLYQSICEILYFAGGPFFQLFYIEQELYHRLEAVDVRTAKDLRLEDFHVCLLIEGGKPQRHKGHKEFLSALCVFVVLFSLYSISV